MKSNKQLIKTPSVSSLRAHKHAARKAETAMDSKYHTVQVSEVSHGKLANNAQAALLKLSQ